MANAHDEKCLDAGPGAREAFLPVNPFLSVRYQFGMLLGVEDFDAADGYPRGKMRLHNAWLHGAGVVWGYDVQASQVNPPDDASLTGELLVKAGLALDAVGHELYLDQDACVDVGAWYAQHKDDQAVKDAAKPTDAGGVLLPLRVELSFATCLARQVPAMSEPCDGATGTSTAYSRARELVRLALAAGPAPARADAYPTLRYLFGLGPAPASPTPHQAAAIAAVDGGWADQAAFLTILRQCTAADGIAQQAATVPPLGRRSYFPRPEDAPPIVLATVAATLAPTAGGAFRMTAADVDVNVRPSHVATSTIQELHCCAPRGGAPGGPPPEQPPPGGGGAPPASGPGAEATLGARPSSISVRSLSLPFDDATLDEKAFSVTDLTSDGWTALDIRSVGLDETDGSGRTVAIALRGTPPKGSLLRLIARGSGPTPLMCVADGGKRVPFRGDLARGSADDGSDFVKTWEVR